MYVPSRNLSLNYMVLNLIPCHYSCNKWFFFKYLSFDKHFVLLTLGPEVFVVILQVEPAAFEKYPERYHTIKLAPMVWTSVIYMISFNSYKSSLRHVSLFPC